MRKLTRLWRAIEDTPSLLAVRACWAERCGLDFGNIDQFLSPTGDLSTGYPCPRPTGYHCPRLIIGGGDGKFEAICQDPHKLCADLSLNTRDVVIQELNLDAFMKPILELAGIEHPSVEFRAPGVWSVGLSKSRDSIAQPSFLLLFNNQDDFGRAVQTLLLEVQGRFILIAPTNRHRTSAIQELIQTRAVTFTFLEDRILVDGEGHLVAVDPVTGGDDWRPTPFERRDELIREFRQKNEDCTIKQICYWANVSRGDFNKWKNAKPEVPDTSVKAIRTERLLQLGIKARE